MYELLIQLESSATNKPPLFQEKVKTNNYVTAQTDKILIINTVF